MPREYTFGIAQGQRHDPELERTVKENSSPAIVNRWAPAFLLVPAALGIVLGAAFWRFQSLHEEFLSVNFDSMHGARTLLKAESLLRETQKELDQAAPANLATAADLLSLAANYGAEGNDRNPEVRANLVAMTQELQSRLSALQQRSHIDSDMRRTDVAKLAQATRKLSEDFSAAEMERWGMLSSLNAELSQRMRQLKLLIGAGGAVFGLVIALLAWSMVRYRQIAHQLSQAKAVAETIQQSTLDTALSGILYLHFSEHGDRCVFRINQRMEEMFGYGADELVGKSALPLYADMETYRSFCAIAYPALSRGETYRTEMQARRKDGSLFWCSLVGRVIDRRDPSVGAVWMLEDISDRKRAEMDLIAAKHSAEEANAAKSRFLAAASHDLRQPMQAISLFANALERTRLSEEQARLSRNLTAAAGALGQLLDTLLDISKLDAGIVKPKVISTDLHDLFRSIESECASLALDKKLRFKLFFPGRPLIFSTDQRLLLGLLRNVIGNSIKYTDKGGVLVGTRLRDEHLLIQVWDTGIGISSENLPKIYDEFFQVSNPQRDRTSGLGLGLSIVKRMAALLGYRIDCRSRLGRGTVFEIRIPFDRTLIPDSLAASSPVTTEVSDALFLNGQRVVIVEDDHFVAEALQAWFEAHGSSVSAFPNGVTALASPAIADADYYVSDFRLPGDMNGIDVLDAIQYRAARPIRGFLMTGDTSAERVGAFAKTRWKVLHKPIDSSTLLNTIAELRIEQTADLCPSAA